jgi:hypothetical protein
MHGMGTAWKKREVAERLIRAAAELVAGWDDGDIPQDEARDYIAGWLKNLPGRAWDSRLGPEPDSRK